ncbi:MAG: hypothetical protein ACPG7F_12880 [Aggregatilineales bacterium]
MMLLRFLPENFPTLATHPLLRHEYKRLNPARRQRERLSRAAGLIFLLAMLVLSGYLYATWGLSKTAGFNPVQALWHTLFFPMIGIQWGLSVAGTILGTRVIQEERRRQTWDKLRSTSRGTKLTLETYRLTIMYRLREGLGVLMLARVVLIGGVLLELMMNRGEYLDMLTGSSHPVMPALIGVLLMAAFLCAGLLLPLASLAFDISVGLWIGTFFQNKTWAFLAQFIFIGLRLSAAFALLILMTDFLQAEWLITVPSAWALTTAYSIFADQGMLFLNSFQVAQIWQLIPYSIFIGLCLMGVALLFAWLSDGLLRLAVRRTEKNH